MKKLMLLVLLLLPASYAGAEIIDKQYTSEGVAGELLIKGARALSEKGLYRIDDHATGYHIYILTTVSTTQIHTVPIRKE